MLLSKTFRNQLPVMSSHILTRIHVGPDHRITGTAPASVPPGEHEVTITLAKPMVRYRAGRPFDVSNLPIIDLGPWPVGVLLRREDIYGDDGR